MAVPFRQLVADRPSVLPETGNAFGQFTQGLYNGFGAGQARHQEDDLPDLMAEAARMFGYSLGNLVDEPPADWPGRAWNEEESDLLRRMMSNPGTRDWAQQLIAAGPRPLLTDSAAMS